MKTARDYRCDLSVVEDEITPLPWSEFCESGDWWIGSVASDGGPALCDPVCNANPMTTQDMLYIVWAANTAPELVALAESQRDLIAALAGALNGLIPLIEATFPQQQRVWLDEARAALARVEANQPV